MTHFSPSLGFVLQWRWKHVSLFSALKSETKLDVTRLQPPFMNTNTASALETSSITFVVNIYAAIAVARTTSNECLKSQRVPIESVFNLYSALGIKNSFRNSTACNVHNKWDFFLNKFQESWAHDESRWKLWFNKSWCFKFWRMPIKDQSSWSLSEQ